MCAEAGGSIWVRGGEEGVEPNASGVQLVDLVELAPCVELRGLHTTAFRVVMVLEFLQPLLPVPSPICSMTLFSSSANEAGQRNKKGNNRPVLQSNALHL